MRLRAGLLCVALGALAGAAAANPPAVSVPEPEGYWTGPAKGDVPATVRGGKVIATAELVRLLEERADVVLIDVDSAPRRPAELAPNALWMPPPHRSIPGSLWIPGAGMGDMPPEFEAFFRERLADATGNDPDRPVVIYCHERCWLSWNAARRAIAFGYRNVHWFPDGIEGWRAANRPTEVVEPLTPPED